MKKLICLLLSVLCLSLPVRAAAPPSSAAAMILLHGPSGRIIAERNARERLPMASTTKIMTALLALECCDMEEEVEIREEWTRVEGSSMYLRAGDVCTVGDLVHGLLLSSGNDAALALAAYCAGDTESFTALMNERAAALGMEDTHFMNPHGLPAEDHYSTAADMARLMAAAMENEAFREVAGERYYQWGEHSYRNHNKLLWQIEGVTGGKTGYTRAAGRCLVSSCCRDGLELICVTLNDRRDWNDHAALYDWGFANYEAYNLTRGTVIASVPVVGAAVESEEAVLGERLCLCLDRGDKVVLTADLPRFVYAPLAAETVCGTLYVWINDEEAARLPLYWAQNVPVS